MKMFVIFSIIIISLTGCNDINAKKEIKNLNILQNKAHIECYSGNKKILDTNSSDKILGTSTYLFTDEKDNKLKQVSADCIITYFN